MNSHNNTTLTHLDLSGKQPDVSELQELANYPNLISLSVSYRDMDLPRINIILANTRLRELILVGARLTDEDANLIIKNSSLLKL